MDAFGAIDPPVKRFAGIGASDGIAIGVARMLAATAVVADRWIARVHVEGELHRLQAAVLATDEQLAAVGQELQLQGRHDEHLIVEVHRLLLRSDDILEGARRLIASEGLAAESAVRRVVDDLVVAFETIRDPYLRERGGDVAAIGDRLIRTLLGSPDAWSSNASAAGSIGVGSALSAIDAIHLKRSGLAGVITERGGKTSHAAIIVRALEIPHVFGIRDLYGSVSAGDTLIVDGRRGDVILNPDPETLLLFQERSTYQAARTRQLRSRPPGATVTADGVRIQIGANIEMSSEIAPAIERGAESVGLFRTEFLYLQRPDLPTEEEQLRDAEEVLVALGGRPATFRTLDLGGEKLPLSVQIPEGPNPNLGMRAIRFSLRRPDIFRTQLRALYRASARGPVRIMFPLISGEYELAEAQAICDEVRNQLGREGVPLSSHVAIGAMIETPSAALTTDHLASRCDFFSVGTNDLIQYTFAADRENADVHYLYHPLHPAVVRLLKYAVDAATFAGKPISVCGDMAGDPAFAWVMLGLGVRELSMAPRNIPAVQSVIASTRLSEAEELVGRVLALSSETEVEDLVMGTMRQRFPLEMGSPSAANGDGEAPASVFRHGKRGQRNT
jgi:phosphotransferase system enzyme I (PtsI)